MNTVNDDRDITALVVIDPYNDFISEGGKVWERLRAVAGANNCVHHMMAVRHAARQARLGMFYAPDELVESMASIVETSAA